jgi:asparagine synthase (glutamine-hydrolysing)
MCGITGIIRTEGSAPDDVMAVKRMTAALHHRGPDADGFHSDRRVVLGHRRLSIIDLSPAAGQPMTNEDGTVWLTYNGEIYNYVELRSELVSHGHQFRSQSDTEVILHGYEEWGIEALLGNLRGMFAFGIYDSRRGLILARDRMGIKPLYYFVGGGELLFASEVKALIASGMVPSQRDPEALAGFLLAGSVPSPLTIIRGVRCLPAGHYLAWKDGSSELRKYWDLEFERPVQCIDGSGDLRAMLEDTVARHLMSEVPLGVFLSGGVDSAALVALASRARSSEITTLTVVFNEHELSEGRAARKIATHFRTRHHDVLITERDFRSELPAVFAAMDQPTNDGVNTYFVSRAARQAGLTVVLSGLGGDEVFWGYGHYRMLDRGLRWLGRCPTLARKALVGSVAALGRLRGRERWTRLAYLSERASGKEAYLSIRGFYPQRQVQRLLAISRAEFETTVDKYFGLAEPQGVNGFNYFEFKRYMHDQLLRDTDTFSMAHSLEVRVPLLDHTIVDYAAHVGASRKVANRINKPLLVNAVNDPLLFEAGARRKQGFSFPMDRWMKRYARELEEMSKGAEGVDPKAVRELWKNFRAGRLHWSRAWALVVLKPGIESRKSTDRVSMQSVL